VQAINPQVIHVQSHINVGFHAAKAALANKVRLVATNHVDAESLVDNVLLIPEFLKRFISDQLIKSASSVFRSADAVIAPTLRSAQLLKSVIAGVEVSSISGGVDVSKYIQLPGGSQARKTITYLGRLDREKHVYVLLEALARLPKEYRLELLGSGSQESELSKLANELGVSNRVDFHDDLDDEQVIEHLGNSSVFVMPSTQELQSMATLEAMAAGLPIVAADSMALPNLVENGVNGFLFKPDSPIDLAEKLQAIFSLTADEYCRFVKSSRLKAAEHDLSKTVGNYIRVYEGKPLLMSSISGDPEYAPEPTVTMRIGNLVRKSSKSLERGANGVLERLDGARGSVIETFNDVRFTIERRGKRVSKKLSSSLRKALERIRRDD
jgi:glycosyltransferase involved in cell wall biosynthesis